MVLSKNVTGFTLIELSIVIALLAIVVGGIISGKHLINSAQIRTQINDLQKLDIAINDFKNKYSYFPGDLPDATAYWGAQTSNGNGNGLVEAQIPYKGSFITPDSSHYNGERRQFFKQLSLSGLIEEIYDTSTTIGIGYPAVRLNPQTGIMASGRWDTENAGNTAIPNTIQATTGRLYLALVIVDQTALIGGSAHNDLKGVFTPEQMWQIDQKVDDGKPESGSVLPQSWGVSPDCTIAGTPYTYNVSATDAYVCNMLFEISK